ncbi:MAG: FUSC family protein [Actinobacteria bacterium]|nr:FUSC family protein [Actinomycetota bacterium]
MSLIERPHDPGLVLLRRALIAAIGAPLLFAIGLALVQDSTFALFAAFAAFAASGLVYFGGPTKKQAAAYLGFMLTGGLLVVLGTSLANSVVGGVIGMLAVGFAVRFVGVFGGYYSIGGNAVLLAFVLPVMVDAPTGSYVPRVTGWLVGCSVAIAAVLIVVRDTTPEKMRAKAAVICRETAKVVRDDGHDTKADRRARADRVIQDIRLLRAEWAALPQRPAGPTMNEQAFLSIFEQLSRLVPFLRRDLDARQHRQVQALAEPLREAVGSTLDGSADLLENHVGDAQLPALDSARVEYRETMRDWVAGQGANAAGGSGQVEVANPALASTVVSRVEQGFALLIVSHEVLSIGANAMLMERKPFVRDPHDFEPDMPEGGRSALGTAERAVRVLRAHLRFSDLTFRVAVRTGVILAIAVYLADLMAAQLGHKFWVVLGAMVVLRSNAIGTSATGLQAVTGTVIGFVLSGLLVQTTSGDAALLWIALVVCTFLAAYAPSAISFTVGQASFTLFVVVLFTIMQPVGWTTSVERLESVATGVLVSVIGGLALWPRGAKAVVGRSMAHFSRTAARYLDMAAYSFVNPGEVDVDAARAIAREARWQADEAFNGLVGEQRSSGEVLVAWVRLMGVPASARMVADSVHRLPERGYPCAGGCPDAVTAVGEELNRVEATLERVASRLMHPRDAIPVSWGSQIAGARAAVVECVARQLEKPQEERESTLGLLFVLESLYALDDLLCHVDEPLDTACESLTASEWK